MGLKLELVFRLSYGVGVGPTGIKSELVFRLSADTYLADRD